MCEQTDEFGCSWLLGSWLAPLLGCHLLGCACHAGGLHLDSLLRACQAL